MNGTVFNSSSVYGAVAAAAELTASKRSVFSHDEFGDYDYESEFHLWIQVWDNQIIIMKVVSLLSAIGSAYIFISIAIGAYRRKKLERTFDRLLLCLCASDFVSSMALFLGSW